MPSHPTTEAPDIGALTPLDQSLENLLLEALITSTLPPLNPTSAPHATPDSASPHPTSAIPHPTSVSALTLARHFRISLHHVLDFIARPSTQSRLAAAASIDDLALQQRIRAARLKALAVLENLLDTSDDPVEKRRAAAILRGPVRTSESSSRISLKEPAAEAPLHEYPDHPLRLEKDHSAQDALHTVLERLEDNDNPFDDAGLRTLYNFLHPIQQNAPITVEQFLKKESGHRLLIDFNAAVITAPHPAAEPTPDSDPDSEPVSDHDPSDKHASFAVKFFFPDLTHLFTTFDLTRAQSGLRHFWHIKKIHFRDNDPNTS